MSDHDEFTVKVKFFGRAQASELSVEVSRAMLVRELKTAIAARLADGTSEDNMKLIYLGRVLTDNTPLGQYGVAGGQTIHLVVKPPEAEPQPARPQPAADSTAASRGSASGGAGGDSGMAEPSGSSGSLGGDEDFFANLAGGGGPAMGGGGGGGVDMGGLFRGIFQNLGAAAPLMQAALARGFPQQQQQSSPTPTPTAAAGGAPGAAHQQPPPSPPPAAASTAGAASGPAGAARAAHQQQQQQQQQANANEPAFTHVRFSGPMMGPALHPHHHMHHHHMMMGMGPHALHHPHPHSPPYQVHVHVTMDELEQLPDRLAQFQSRMAERNMAAIARVVNHDGPVGAAGLAAAGAQNAARRPDPASVAHGQPQHQSSPRAGQTSENLRSLAAAAGITAEQTQTDTLLSALKAAAAPGDMGETMRFMNGDWSIVEKCRQPIKDLVARRLAGRPATPALRVELVEESVVDAMAHLRDHPAVQREVAARVRPGVDAYPLIHAALRLALRELVDLTLDAGPQVNYPAAFRAAMVRRVGHLLAYAEQRVFRNGRSDTQAVLNAAIAAGTQEALRSRPDLAPFAGAAPMMLIPTLLGWQMQYVNDLRRASDDGDLESEARRTVAVSTRGRSVAAGGAGSSSSEAAAADDDVLDACLEAVTHQQQHQAPGVASTQPAAAAAASAAAAGNAATTSTSLAAMLRGSNLPDAARLASWAERDAAAPATSVPPPPQHYFAGESSRNLD